MLLRYDILLTFLMTQLIGNNPDVLVVIYVYAPMVSHQAAALYLHPYHE